MLASTWLPMRMLCKMLTYQLPPLSYQVSSTWDTLNLHYHSASACFLHSLWSKRDPKGYSLSIMLLNHLAQCYQPGMAVACNGFRVGVLGPSACTSSTPWAAKPWQCRTLQMEWKALANYMCPLILLYLIPTVRDLATPYIHILCHHSSPPRQKCHDSLGVKSDSHCYRICFACDYGC